MAEQLEQEVSDDQTWPSETTVVITTHYSLKKLIMGYVRTLFATPPIQIRVTAVASF